MTKTHAIILELDGVLCDDSKRRHLIDPWTAPDGDYRFAMLDSYFKPDYTLEGGIRGKIDYEAYYAACGEDGVNEWCEEILHGMYYLRNEFIFVTNRPEKYRDITSRWLSRNTPSGSDYILFMRPDFLDEARSCFNGKMCGESRQDTRPSHMVKQEIYEREIQDKYEILFVIDKGEDADMWKSLGLTTLEMNCMER